jgi:hypothetical protein
MGHWMQSPPTNRHSMVTVSSTTTAAMSHDPLELSEPPPRAPSPLRNLSSGRSLHNPSHSRSQLRLSTNLAPGPLEPVGEASSTSETSQNQQNPFYDRTVSQPNPSETNEGLVNESSGEREFHQHETTDQNEPSTLPPDNSATKS